MSKIYPNLEYFSEREEEYRSRSVSNLETNCGQIFSKGTALTRDLIEKIEETELGTAHTVFCGYEFRTRQLWHLAGLILLLTASCMGMGLMFGTTMFDGYILSNLVLTNNSATVEMWRAPPVTILVKVYIFNYTNVDEYERGYEEKLNVEEIGPFVYEEKIEKVNVQFHPNGTVSYQESRVHKFRADLSKGRRQSDRVTVPNLPLLGAAAKHKHSYYMTRLATSALLQGLNSKPFLNLPAHRFIWGYDDNLYSLAKSVMSYQKKLPSEQFGILAARNGTSDDFILINTGLKDVNKIGAIERVNGESTLSHWSTEECNRIEGTDGSVFPSFTIRQKKPVYVYNKDICRKLPLVFQEEVKLLNEKVNAYRYVMPDTVFDRPETDPENQCYCDMDSGECPPQGTFNATPCFYGAPVFLSFPHFYNADSELVESISGLNPAHHKQNMNYVDVHPTYGIVMGGQTRLQINVEVKKSFGMLQLDMFPDDVMLPISWMEFSVDANDFPNVLKDGIHTLSVTVPAIEMSLKYGCLLTVIVTLSAVIISLKGKWNERRHRIRRLQINTSIQSEQEFRG